MILTVGLTGGLASGKSTVARMLAELGAEVIDADAEGQAQRAREALRAELRDLVEGEAAGDLGLT